MILLLLYYAYTGLVAQDVLNEASEKRYNFLFII